MRRSVYFFVQVLVLSPQTLKLCYFRWLNQPMKPPLLVFLSLSRRDRHRVVFHGSEPDCSSLPRRDPNQKPRHGCGGLESRWWVCVCVCSKLYSIQRALSRQSAVTLIQHVVLLTRVIPNRHSSPSNLSLGGATEVENRRQTPDSRSAWLAAIFC